MDSDGYILYSLFYIYIFHPLVCVPSMCVCVSVCVVCVSPCLFVLLIPSHFTSSHSHSHSRLNLILVLSRLILILIPIPSRLISSPLISSHPCNLVSYPLLPCYHSPLNLCFALHCLEVCTVSYDIDTMSVLFLCVRVFVGLRFVLRLRVVVVRYIVS